MFWKRPTYSLISSNFHDIIRLHVLIIHIVSCRLYTLYILAIYSSKEIYPPYVCLLYTCIPIMYCVKHQENFFYKLKHGNDLGLSSNFTSIMNYCFIYSSKLLQTGYTWGCAQESACFIDMLKLHFVTSIENLHSKNIVLIYGTWNLCPNTGIQDTDNLHLLVWMACYYRAN